VVSVAGVSVQPGAGLLTVARSFWVSPLFCRPSWMTLPTSRDTRWWWSSSVSRSSLAVFLVTRCCLFCPADPVSAVEGEKIVVTLGS
ncbi:hypothetical protein CRUP_007358, partial [Coryphaenoides rupestris]